jgi:hypothetical protein
MAISRTDRSTEADDAKQAEQAHKLGEPVPQSAGVDWLRHGAHGT